MKAAVVSSFLAASAAFLAIPQAQALSQDGSGAYLGGGLGRSRLSFDGGSFASNSANVADSQDRTKNGYTGFVGYDFNRNWALEAGYTRLGKFNYNYTGVNALAGATGQAGYTASSWWLAGKGTVALTDRFDLYGKLGLAENRARDSVATNSAGLDAILGSPATRNTSKSSVLAGLGAEYHLTKAVGVRLEYDNYGRFGASGSQNLAKAGEWTADLAYHF